MSSFVSAMSSGASEATTTRRGPRRGKDPRSGDRAPPPERLLPLFLLLLRLLRPRRRRAPSPSRRAASPSPTSRRRRIRPRVRSRRRPSRRRRRAAGGAPRAPPRARSSSLCALVVHVVVAVEVRPWSARRGCPRPRRRSRRRRRPVVVVRGRAWARARCLRFCCALHRLDERRLLLAVVSSARGAAARSRSRRPRPRPRPRSVSESSSSSSSSSSSDSSESSSASMSITPAPSSSKASSSSESASGSREILSRERWCSSTSSSIQDSCPPLFRVARASRASSGRPFAIVAGGVAGRARDVARGGGDGLVGGGGRKMFTCGGNRPSLDRRHRGRHLTVNRPSSPETRKRQLA